MNKKYAICVASIMILILGAIFGPQLVFDLQDSYRMDTTWQGQRNSLDVEALNNSYDSMRNRFLSFAEGLENNQNYYVTGTDYQVTEESYALLEQIFPNGLGFLSEWGLMYSMKELYSVGFTVEEWKKYVGYADSFEEGTASVAFMAWYIELTISNEHTVKLLVDAEDYVLYYAQCIYSDDEEVKEKYGNEQYALPIFDAGTFAYIAEYCYFYFEAGEKEAGSYQEFEEWLAEWHIEEDAFFVKLPYGENTLVWEMNLKLTYSPNQVMVYMGIQEIGRLIPEFAE